MEFEKFKQFVEKKLCEKNEVIECNPEAEIGENNFIPYHKVSYKCGCAKLRE